MKAAFGLRAGFLATSTLAAGAFLGGAAFATGAFLTGLTA